MERDIQTSEPEAPTGPDERGGYAEREDERFTKPTGGGHSGPAGESGGGDNPAHTPLDEEHPAGTGERSTRDVGGPVAGEDAPEDTGGATGTKQTPGHDPHE